MAAQQPQTAVATQPVTSKTVAPVKIVTPDYVGLAKKQHAEILTEIESNPIFERIIASTDDKEKRIEAAIAYLVADLEKPNVEQLDQRRQMCVKFNTFVQTLRTQLGGEQVKEITSKSFADLDNIIKVTTGDTAGFEQQLVPLNRLAELWSQFGADGNIVEKLNAAKAQQEQRMQTMVKWQTEHTQRVGALETEVSRLSAEIDTKKLDHESKSHGIGSYFSGYTRLQLEADIQVLEAERTERLSQLETARAETPDAALVAQLGEIDTQVDESILALQNIGGEEFKNAILNLRDSTEGMLAKMSTNFDQVVVSLTGTRDTFIKLDRNCTDATFALSVLDVAVKRAEKIARKIAEDKLAEKSDNADPELAELDRMERENQSEQILSYTSSLTSFANDLNLAVTSLRKGQAVIKNVLNMTNMAIEQCNTHKVTGIANMSDAATITIASIISLCNRASGRVLIDGLNKVLTVASKGNERVMTGATEALSQQNEVLGDFVKATSDLKGMMLEITASSVELIKQQSQHYRDMSLASGALAEATTDAERATFNARAGVGEEAKKPDAPAATPRRSGFGLLGGAS